MKSYMFFNQWRIETNGSITTEREKIYLGAPDNLAYHLEKTAKEAHTMAAFVDMWAAGKMDYDANDLRVLRDFLTSLGDIDEYAAKAINRTRKGA